MPTLSFLAAAMGAALLSYVHSASIATTTDSASADQAGELKPRLAASNGGFEIWDRNLVLPGQGSQWDGRYDWERRTKYEYNHTVEVNTYSYQEGNLLSGWMIAVIVIVPLIVIITLVTISFCAYRACTRRKGYSYAYQAEPPPYPVDSGMRAVHTRCLLDAHARSPGHEIYTS